VLLAGKIDLDRPLDRLRASMLVLLLGNQQVGDPLKDTSGPSLNILVKLMAVESLVSE
jgi:Na+/H+-translocating membrane pyrophosphatase